MSVLAKVWDGAVEQAGAACDAVAQAGNRLTAKAKGAGAAAAILAGSAAMPTEADAQVVIDFDFTTIDAASGIPAGTNGFVVFSATDTGDDFPDDPARGAYPNGVDSFVVYFETPTGYLFEESGLTSQPNSGITIIDNLDFSSADSVFYSVSGLSSPSSVTTGSTLERIQIGFIDSEMFVGDSIVSSAFAVQDRFNEPFNTFSSQTFRFTIDGFVINANPYNMVVTAVPEPSAFAAVAGAIALAGVGLRRRRDNAPVCEVA